MHYPEPLTAARAWAKSADDTARLALEELQVFRSTVNGAPLNSTQERRLKRLRSNALGWAKEAARRKKLAAEPQNEVTGVWVDEVARISEEAWTVAGQAVQGVAAEVITWSNPTPPTLEQMHQPLEQNLAALGVVSEPKQPYEHALMNGAKQWNARSAAERLIDDAKENAYHIERDGVTLTDQAKRAIVETVLTRVSGKALPGTIKLVEGENDCCIKLQTQTVNPDTNKTTTKTELLARGVDFTEALAQLIYREAKKRGRAIYE
jgi:hypothetical protein